MNKEILKIVDRVLAEEVTNRISKVKNQILESENMCSECGTGYMEEGVCNECGYMQEEINELGGMDDGHPRFGNLRLKDMSRKEIERLLRGDDDMDSEEEEFDMDTDDFDVDMDYEEELGETDVEEGNAFTGALAKAKDKGEESFMVNGKKFNVKESQINEKWKGKVKVEKTGEHAGKTIEEIDNEIKDLKEKTKKYQKEGKKVPAKMRETMSELYFAKRAKKDTWKSPVAVKENKFYFTESEIVEIIENIVNEEKKSSKNPDNNLTKSLSASKKENEKNISDVVKKMKDYLKDGSKGTYEMNPKHFPKGNGELAKMDKKAYIASNDVEEYVDNFTAAGLENLDYDDIKPNEDWVTDNVVGSERTGNKPDWANAVETPVNKKRDKIRKDNLLAKIKRKSYGKAPQPVNDTAGENTDKGSKILMNLESTEDKKVLSEISKMKSIIGYQQKTQ
jgi:hypothetical protein